MAAAQQRLATKQRGSKNRAKARQTLAARHRKIANQRRDFHHKSARYLVQSYDLIAVEHLQIANMQRRAKPMPDPEHPGRVLPNGGAAKTGLNRSISDAGWGQFLSILRAKAEDAGRIWIHPFHPAGPAVTGPAAARGSAVNPRHTSDGCEACGHIAQENRVSQSEFVCRACGHAAQADEHAARNILRAGLALHAAIAA